MRDSIVMTKGFLVSDAFVSSYVSDLNELLRASCPQPCGLAELLKNAPSVFIRKNMASNLGRHISPDLRSLHEVFRLME